MTNAFHRGTRASLSRLKRVFAQLLLWASPFRYVLGTLKTSIEKTLPTLHLADDAKVLDYGCGGKPYRRLFPDRCIYVGADLASNSAAADLVIEESGRVPVPDSTIDIVLSTQVLEHVRDPDLYLRECHRVLKPGGKLLLTTHGLMFYHEFPNDFWRWTADGLKLIVQRAELRVLSVDGVIGLIPTSIWHVMFNYQARLPWGLRQVFVLICNLAMLASDRMTSDGSRLRNACVYAVVADRPA